MLAAEPSQRPVSEGVRSLEVRWIFPGQLESAVARWFGRFPAETESREDTYLLDPWLRGLSVKVRGGVALDVKMYRGSLGILDLAGRARGRMESWQKWSFPVDPFPRTAVTWSAGDRYGRDGESAGSHLRADCTYDHGGNVVEVPDTLAPHPPGYNSGDPAIERIYPWYGFRVGVIGTP